MHPRIIPNLDDIMGGVVYTLSVKKKKKNFFRATLAKIHNLDTNKL